MMPTLWTMHRSCRDPCCRRCYVVQGGCCYPPCCRNSHHNRWILRRYLILIREAFSSRGWTKLWTWNSSVVLIPVLLTFCIAFPPSRITLCVYSRSSYVHNKLLFEVTRNLSASPIAPRGPTKDLSDHGGHQTSYCQLYSQSHLNEIVRNDVNF